MGLICKLFGHRLNPNSLTRINKEIVLTRDVIIGEIKVSCDRCGSHMILSEMVLYTGSAFNEQSLRLEKHLDGKIFSKNKEGRFVIYNGHMCIHPDAVIWLIETTKNGDVIVKSNRSHFGNIAVNNFIARLEYYLKKYNEQIVKEEVVRILVPEEDSTEGQLSLVEKNDD